MILHSMRYLVYAFRHGCFYMKKYYYVNRYNWNAGCLMSGLNNQRLVKQTGTHTHTRHTPSASYQNKYLNKLPESSRTSQETPKCTSWKFPPTTDLPWDFATTNTHPIDRSVGSCDSLASNGLGFAAGLLPNNPKRLLLPAAACKKKCVTSFWSKNTYIPFVKRLATLKSSVLLWKVLQPLKFPLFFCCN